jgi:Flp pilus assembly protein CpaB
MTVACVGVGIYQTWASKIEVLVATEDLDHKTEITKTNVKFARWPAEIVPEGAITSKEGIPIGDFILTRLRKGQAIIGEDVFSRSTLTHITIPAGYKVINIKIPTTNGRLLRSGDRVDVIAIEADGGWDDESEPLLEGVRVFNVGSSPNSSRIVGLLVTEKQASVIADHRGVNQLDVRP